MGGAREGREERVWRITRPQRGSQFDNCEATNTYKFIAHTLNVKPHIRTTRSHEILFTTHTYLTFALSLINADGRNAAVDPLRVELFTRPFLPSPLSPRPHRKGLGTKLGFFKVRKNLIFERARFNQRNQSEGESVEQYITALYHLVETCEYGDLRDEMLRDRLVVGICDSAMSQKLQMDPEPTLEKAMKAVRQSAAVKEQQGQLKQLKEGSKGNPITIEEVRTGRPQTGGGASRKDKSVRYRKGGAKGTQPRMQGGAKWVKGNPNVKAVGDHLPGERCPAKPATCYKCNTKGHFSSQCFSKTVAASAEELSLDTAFLGVLNSGKTSPWTVSQKLEGIDTHFKMDTGAEVTAISECTFHSLKGVTLTKPTKILHGPTGRPMKVLGQFTGTLSSKDKQANEPVYVIRGLRTNLLGLPVITALKLVARIDATSSTE